MLKGFMVCIMQYPMCLRVYLSTVLYQRSDSYIEGISISENLGRYSQFISPSSNMTVLHGGVDPPLHAAIKVCGTSYVLVQAVATPPEDDTWKNMVRYLWMERHGVVAPPLHLIMK